MVCVLGLGCFHVDAGRVGGRCWIGDVIPHVRPGDRFTFWGATPFAQTPGRAVVLGIVHACVRIRQTDESGEFDNPLLFGVPWQRWFLSVLARLEAIIAPGALVWAFALGGVLCKVQNAAQVVGVVRIHTAFCLFRCEGASHDVVVRHRATLSSRSVFGTTQAP